MAPEPQNRTRVAFVVQRYGPEIIGGAESHARHLCERLAGSLGWDIEIFTTTAKDYTSWANEYAPRSEEIGGVKVHRFPVVFRRTKLFSVYNRATAGLLRALRKVQLLHPLCRYLEHLWILLQGPVSPELVQTLVRREGEFHFIIAMTYLYYPTLMVLRQLGHKTILIPTAHDEPPFYFLTVQEAVNAAKALAPNSEAEAQLIRAVMGAPGQTVEIAGAGIEVAEGLRAERNSAARYFVYLGRVSRGKGVDQLIAWFAEGKSRDLIPADVELHLIGQRDDDFPAGEQPGVRFLGPLHDKEKDRHIAQSVGLINPSAKESLSLITLEAMTLEVPAIVNGASEVLRHYAEETGSVFAYGTKTQFFECCGKVLAVEWNDDQHAAILREARDWVMQRYSWSKVVAAFERLSGLFR